MMAAPQLAGEAKLAVVIPAFNEAGNIGLLIQEVVAAIPPALLREIVVVDDGSEDETGREIDAMHSLVPQVRAVRHDRRSGQSAALRTGVRIATAPLVATLDGDGQNDPHDIPALLAALEAASPDGIALAGGIRTKRRAESSKRIASKAANWLRDAILADGCPDTGCGLKVFRRDVFLDLPYFSGMHRYLPALVQAYGFGAVYVPVNDRPRRAGVSKYTNLGRALIGVYDLIGVRWLIKRTILPDPARHAASATAPAKSSHEEASCLPN